MLPREKVFRTLRVVLCGTHVRAMLNHRSLALIGPARRSCDSFVALLGSKPNSACEHQCSGYCKNCRFHTLVEFSFELNLQGTSVAGFSDLANCLAIVAPRIVTLARTSAFTLFAVLGCRLILGDDSRYCIVAEGVAQPDGSCVHNHAADKRAVKHLGQRELRPAFAGLTIEM